MMDLVALFTILLLCTTGGVFIGYGYGKDRGEAMAFGRFLDQLKFERRPDEDPPLIEPTGQPRSRNPKGRARVTTAHVSQVRSNWNSTE